MKTFLLLSLSMLVALLPASRGQNVTISTVAGNAGQRSGDGTGSSARFNNPWGVAVDATGDIYVADTDSHVIRKVTSGGIVTTVAGSAGTSGSADGTGSSARFNSPQGIAVDAEGNLYVTDSGNHTIRQITPSAVVTTLAGSAGVSGAVDGSGGSASFNNPEGIVLSGTSLYVADTWNHTIRAVTLSGVVTTFAGTAGTPGMTDGNGTSASFNSPQGIAVDATGSLYVADTGNQLIRFITSSGGVSTFAGSAGAVGSSDGAAGSALFSDPSGIAVDAANNVYVADAFNNTIRKIAAGTVTTLVGTAGTFGSADGNGSAASFWLPQGLAVDTSAIIYLADSGNGTIRKISGTTASTIAGAASIGSSDGVGSNARFFFPAGACVDDSGDAYVADTLNHTVRKVTSSGSVSTLAGVAGVSGSADGSGTSARFNAPQGIARDSSGTLYVADTANHTIRKLTGTSVSLLAGTSGTSGWQDGTGSSALFNYPQDVAVDGGGNVYVADTWNHVIREITSAGVVTTLAGEAGYSGDSDGTGPAVGTNSARFYAPGGVAVDGSGNVYVADTRNHLIRQVTPNGVVSTLAGLGGNYGCADGASNNARFFFPQAIAVDASGDLFVLDSGNQTIRKMTQSGGVWTVTTVAGNASVTGTADGIGSAAQFFDPAGLGINASGTLVIADLGNNTIRSSATVAPTVITSPTSQTINQGQDATFTVTTWGNSPSYQWYFNADIISGATDSSYTKTNAQAGDAGSYSVVVNNSAGSDTSASAVLTVIVPPAIVTQPMSQIVATGTNVLFTVTTSGSNPTYQWKTNSVNIPGATNSSLSLLNVSMNDGATYTVAVTNAAGTATSSGATLTVLDPPVITGQPSSTTVNRGDNVLFSVGATGSDLSYQWRKDNVILPGATSSQLSLTGVSGTSDGSYDVIISNAVGTVTSAPALLTVNCATITLSPATLSSIKFGAVPPSIVASGGAAPYNIAVTSGSVPSGLFLNPDGTWTGNAIEFTTNTFNVSAIDTNGCVGVVTYTLAVAPSGPATDNTKPVVTIKSPTNRTVTVVSNVTVSGRASDPGTAKSGVAIVFYSLNGGSQQVAATANQFTNWLANVTLQPGWNTFVAQAFDFQGHGSALASNVYFCGAMTNVIGNYNGLFFETNSLGAPSVTEQSAGAVHSLVVQASRAFAGRLLVHGGNYPLKGVFDLAGDCTTNVSRAVSGRALLTVTLHADWTGATKQITGTVSCDDEGWSAPLLADLAVFNAKKNPHPVSRYTMAIPPASDATNSPEGYGYGLVSIAAGGGVTLNGALADSTPISETVPVSKDGQWPLYVNLYSSQGLLEGWIDLSSGAPVGEVTWIKPANPTNVKLTTYLGGFTNEVNVFGSFYAPVVPSITLSNDLLEITGASGLNLPLTLGATVSATNSIARLPGTTNALSGSIAKKTGLLKVTFRPTGVGPITKTATGVVLQSSNAAYGAFIGNNDGTGKTNTGSVYLH